MLPSTLYLNLYHYKKFKEKLENDSFGHAFD